MGRKEELIIEADEILAQKQYPPEACHGQTLPMACGKQAHAVH